MEQEWQKCSLKTQHTLFPWFKFTCHFVSVIYCCITNYPYTSAAQDNTYFLSNSFCGSGVWAWLSWVLPFTLWSRFNQGSICFQAHFVLLAGFNSLWAVELRPLVPWWLLARGRPQFRDMWVSIEQHVSSKTAREPATRWKSCILNLVTKVKSQNPYCIPSVRIKSKDFLVVPWLRLHAPNVGDLGSIHGQGTRSHMPQLRVQMAKLRPGSAKYIN